MPGSDGATTSTEDSEELPVLDDDGGTSLGMPIDGGLTVSEALATEATGTLAVKGHLFDDGTGPQLCEGLVGLGEQYGCDGEHIALTNLDLATIGDALVFHEGLTYTEDAVTLFGELVDGSFIVDSLVTG